jgi:hypothetical protein
MLLEPNCKPRMEPPGGRGKANEPSSSEHDANFAKNVDKELGLDLSTKQLHRAFCSNDAS